MRLFTFSKLLALGGTAAWAVTRLVRSTKPAPKSNNLTARDYAPDPRDPVQGFDEAADLYVTDLSLDALDAADAEAAQDLAAMENDFDDASRHPLEVSLGSMDVGVEEDTGELYGVPTPVAVDRAIPDDDAAFDEGQNWIEALETSSIEYGTEPEAELDVVDDIDAAPHPSDMRDTPVADRGSGGPAGV